MQIERIGIAGFGAMGSGIAQVVASAGYSVTAWDRDETSLERGKSALDDSTDKAMDSGTLGEEEKKNILASMTFSTNMADLKESDLIIESVSEDLELKKRVFSDLSAEVKEEAILATSTSCFSVTEISQSAKNPQRVIGLHFFKPPQDVKLVEVVQAETSSQESVNLALEFCSKIGKEAVVAKDSPGFIVDYLFVPYMNQALDYYDHGLADREGLDTALRMGLGYPKGPLTLIDQMGLDEYLILTSMLYERLKDSRFAPPPILQRMVDGGKLGQKTGQGFYSYDP